MVSAAKPVVEGAPPAAASTTTLPVARLNARISAYLVDSIVLLAFIMVFFVLGGLIPLLSSDLGAADAPAAALHGFLGLLVGGTPLAWSAFNVGLMRWRGQTAGMYVIGIKTVSEDAAPLSTGRLLLRWVGLHPLLFHPLLLPLWTTASFLVFSLTVPLLLLVVTLMLALLCLAAPVAGLIVMITDPERRALHDRLARTRVVHFDQP